MKFITASAIAMAALFGIMWLGWQAHPWMTFGQAGRLIVHEWSWHIIAAGIVAVPAIVYVWVRKDRSK